MKHLFVLPLVLFSLFCCAQHRKSLSIGYGNGSVHFSGEKLIGGPTYKTKSLNLFGINYRVETHKNLFVELGATYFNQEYSITSNFNPTVPTVSRASTIKLINIPVKVRYELGKYFFVNGGPFVDINLSDINLSQSEYDFSGIGASIGVGLQYNFTPKIGIFINPQFNFHDIIGFEKPPYHLNEASVTGGISFHF